ncbi:MAG TPA: FAD-dependent oxidoreductase [Candidatus Thermoplasmatota archaeon]|nr:FAD-dependent oxidoreductase [Candidatus Thermoplasmatota archaeon]
MTKILVVGGNGAGMSAASKAKRRDPKADVTVLEAGEHVSYSSCGIRYHLDGTVADPNDLLVLTPGKAKERGLKVQTGTKAVALNPYNKKLVVEGPKGRDDMAYDKLCIAIGTEAHNPFPGRELKGVHTLRHLGDGVRLMADLKTAPSSRVAIVGGGVLGLEMAESFRKRGAEVHLLQRGKRLLTDFDADMTDGLDDLLAGAGIELHLDAQVKSLAPGKDGRVGGVVTAKRKVAADTVLVAVGVRPATEWCIKAGLESTREGFLIVDDRCKTNLHDVYAAGDCVAARHIVTGRPAPVPLALPANRMGRVAGDNMAGGSAYFAGVLGTAITRIFGIGMAVTGLTEESAKAEGFDVAAALVETPDKARYLPGASDLAVKLVADRDSGKLMGAQVAAPDEGALRINSCAVAIQAGMTVKKLAEAETAYAPPFGPVWDPVVVCASELAKKLRK